MCDHPSRLTITDKLQPPTRMLSRTDLSVFNSAHAYLVLLQVEVARFTSVHVAMYILVSVALFLAFGHFK